VEVLKGQSLTSQNWLSYLLLAGSKCPCSDSCAFRYLLLPSWQNLVHLIQLFCKRNNAACPSLACAYFSTPTYFLQLCLASKPWSFSFRHAELPAWPALLRRGAFVVQLLQLFAATPYFIGLRQPAVAFISDFAPWVVKQHAKALQLTFAVDLYCTNQLLVKDQMVNATRGENMRKNDQTSPAPVPCGCNTRRRVHPNSFGCESETWELVSSSSQLFEIQGGYQIIAKRQSAIPIFFSRALYAHLRGPPLANSMNSRGDGEGSVRY
jgi:hypothetical protein